MNLRDVIRQINMESSTAQYKRSYTRVTLVAVDYPTSTKVAGKPNYKWAREYNNPNNVFQVFAPQIQDAAGLPVRVSKSRQPPYFRREAVDIDYDLLEIGENNGGANIPSALAAHGITHEWIEGAPNGDVFNIYARAIYPLAVRRVSGMIVYVTAGVYKVAASWVKYGGALLDLTSYLPASGKAKRLCLYIRKSTNLLSVQATSEVNSTLDPPYEFPTVTGVPVGWIKLLDTTTEITEDLISDPRAFMLGDDVAEAVHTHDDRYYTETELNTSEGGGLVHWDNIVGKPLISTAWFLHEEVADIAGYQRLLTEPAEDAENEDTATIVNATTEYPLQEFVSYPTTGLGINLLDGGTWQFVIWTKVSNVAGTTVIVVRVYKRSEGGTETELFNFETDEINDTSAVELTVNSIQPDYVIDTTDRLVIKYFAKSSVGSNQVVSLYYEGTTHYSHFHTPGGSGGGGASQFTDLTDTPASYTGNATELVTVNAGEDALEFVERAGIDSTAIHDNVAGEIAAITQKVTPAASDLILIEDSDDTNAKKYITAGSIVNQAAGAADPSFYVDGYLAVGTNVGGVYIAPRTLGIQAVYIYCKTPGTAGSTIVDINKNGTTIFSTQANRPTLAYDDANGWAKGTPDVTALVEGDILTIDIDQIATGAVSLVVVIAFASYGGANTFLALSDTPASYSGQALKALRVNAGETQIEFYAPTPNLIDEVVSDASAVYLEITSIPGTYKNLVIDFIARSSKAAVTNDLAYVFLNGDTTAENYRRQIYFNTTLNGANNNSFIGTIPGANGLANNFAHYRLVIQNYASTLSEHAVFVDGAERRAATEHYKWWGYVFWENTAAITSVRIGVVDDNLVSGSILRVWGEI